MRVWWEADAAWYTAAVRAFDSNRGEHLLVYALDGVEAWTDLSSEKWALEQKNTGGEGAQPPRSHAAGAGGGGGRRGGDKGGAPGGERLLGRTLSVFRTPSGAIFGQAGGEWVDATVIDFRAADGLHLCAFEGGERAWLPLSPSPSAPQFEHSNTVRWPPFDSLTQQGVSAALSALRACRDREGRTLAPPFERLPSPEQLPHYYETIARPIDFEEIERRVGAGAYPDGQAFAADVARVFSNAVEYNGVSHPLGVAAKRLSVLFLKAAGKDGALLPLGGGEVLEADLGGNKRKREETPPPPPPPPPPVAFKFKVKLKLAEPEGEAAPVEAVEAGEAAAPMETGN